MSAPAPNPGPEILSLAQVCEEHMSRARADEFARSFAPASGPEIDEPTDEELEAFYVTACGLCDEGSFRFASAVALHIVAHKPCEPRYTFLAGTCMQRMEMPSSAAQFFCSALFNGGDHPASLFRLGECLLALGDTVNADRAFDAALDVARDVEGSEELQYASQRLMESIRDGAHSSM